MKKLNLLLIFVLFSISILGQNQEKRLALIIGNADYEHGGKLKNPVNDANLMAATLSKLGFKVTKLTNAGVRQMQSAAIAFTKKIKDYDVALFYYAGHGIQVDGINYLIPIDAQLEDQLSVRYEAFNISDINYAFRQNSSNMNIMILDACRNNPFRSWARGNARGFKAISDQASGTIIAFATREGETSSDGKGNNGLYTSKLVEQIKKPQSLNDVFKNTRIQVLKESSKKQCPQEWDMTVSNFYFTKKVGNTQTIPEHLQINTTTGRAGTLELISDYTGRVVISSIRGVKLRTKDVWQDGTYTFSGLPAGIVMVNIYANSQLAWSDKIYITGGQTIRIKTKKQSISTPVDTPEMVFIKGGTFNMGSYAGEDDEKPVHSVTINDFYIGKYEVTVAEFEKFINATGYKTDAEKKGYSWVFGTDQFEKKNGINWRYNTSNSLHPKSDYNKPVIHVSWNDAIAYCKWLSQRTGKNYRLPTEAEWEYAAGGGNEHQKWAGTNSENSLGNYVWYGDNAKKTTHNVGSKEPNKFGLYDITGNVCEWCSDWFSQDYYSNSPSGNPQGPASGSDRVYRGGSWYDNAYYCRVALRVSGPSYYSEYGVGFRLAVF